jgi:hypothetical protein
VFGLSVNSNLAIGTLARRAKNQIRNRAGSR